MGNLLRHLTVLNRIKATKSVDILALGGSITAGGYFNEFARSLEVKEGLKVSVHNHGHGATEIQCELSLMLCFRLLCMRIMLGGSKRFSCPNTTICMIFTMSPPPLS